MNLYVECWRLVPAMLLTKWSVLNQWQHFLHLSMNWANESAPNIIIKKRFLLSRLKTVEILIRADFLNDEEKRELQSYNI